MVGVTAATAQDDKKAGKLDPEKLVGTYMVTEGQKAGEKVGDEAKKGAVIFTKEKITIKGEDGMDFVFTYTLDAKADPATVDMEMILPEALKGAKALGIISMSGDEARLCYHPEGKERPKKFESSSENGYHLFTMKKGKAADKPKVEPKKDKKDK